MNETTKKESRQMDMLHGKIFKNMLIVGTSARRLQYHAAVI